MRQHFPQPVLALIGCALAGACGSSTSPTAASSTASANIAGSYTLELVPSPSQCSQLPTQAQGGTWAAVIVENNGAFTATLTAPAGGLPIAYQYVNGTVASSSVFIDVLLIYETLPDGSFVEVSGGPGQGTIGANNNIVGTFTGSWQVGRFTSTGLFQAAQYCSASDNEFSFQH